MNKVIALASTPLIFLSLTACSFAQPFGGNCDSLKTDVKETRKVMAIIADSFDGGIVGKQQPIWDAGYDNVNGWVDDMTQFNGNYQAIKAGGKLTSGEEQILDVLLDDLDSDKFAERLDADDAAWFRETGNQLDAIAEVCGF